MAGIGVKLNRIFSKNTIATDLVGFGYSTVVTIAPMLLVIAALVVEELTLGFSGVGFYRRELFSCTILYIFIFGLLTASPFNPVLSKYMSDVIYNETYEDILPCYYVGLLMNISFSLLPGVPFCLWEFFVGKVPMYYVFTGFCGYISLVLVFYSMLYLSICKDYKKISLYFTFGMVLAVLLSFVFVYLFRMEVTYSMLLSLVIGFFLIACLELSLVTSYFRKNSGKYKQVLQYFKKYWKLVGTNFLYILGLYIHNFVFWTTDGRMIVAKSFVCMQPYDMATCLAMFTNISASVIFITRVEMYFHDRYKAYSEAVIGGRGMDIDNAKSRMFRQLNSELMNLVRIQFVVTVVIFMLCITFLPNLGFGGMTMKIYPCLAAGYFVLFVMYAQIIFLYYFSDTTGSLLTAVVFCLGTLLGSIWATTLPIIWYGLGLVIGSLLGWTVAFFRIRYIERHLEGHIFCRERIMKAGEGEKPSNLVFDRYAAKESAERG
ncbi:MAG: exopolysaccharide Pel transporter PelG [Acetatifactor sp.]